MGPRSGIIISQPASQPATLPPILKVEYLSNHRTDLTQIWNSWLGDQAKVYKCFKWRRPLREDDLKILNVEYLSNHWTDLAQIWNSSLGDQTEVYKMFNEDDP